MISFIVRISIGCSICCRLMTESASVLLNISGVRTIISMNLGLVGFRGLNGVNFIVTLVRTSGTVEDYLWPW